MQLAINNTPKVKCRPIWDELHSDQRGVTTIEWITLGCVLIVLMMIFFNTFRQGGETLATQIMDGLSGLTVAFDGRASAKGNSNTADQTGDPSTSDIASEGSAPSDEEKLSLGEQIIGGFVGFGKSVWGAGEGIVVLVYDGAILTSPIIAPIVYATAPDYYNEKLNKYKQVGQAIWDDPGAAAYAMVENIVEPWKEGRYGEAIGAGLFEVLSFWIPGDEVGKAGKVASAAAKVDKAVPDEILAKLARGEKLTPDEASELARASAKLSPDELADLERAIPCSFSADTLVTTITGLRAISTLAVGEMVLAYNEDQNEAGYYPVSATMNHLDPFIVWLNIDGEQIETTPEHPFYTTDNQWVPAGGLQIGDFIRQANGASDVVQSIEIVQHPQVMYNLSVDDAHTFFVGEGQWLVHNQCDISKIHYPSLLPEERIALNETVQKIRNGSTDGLHAHPYQNSDKLLPSQNSVTYTTYDVAYPAGSTDRGVRRVVAGSDGSIYYTNTHYGDIGGEPFYRVK